MLAAINGPGEFALALASIIGINLVLAGDNAVVIALAARTLPAALRRKAIVFGTLFAVALRIVLTVAVVALLHVPLLKVLGGLLLLWIAVRLAAEDEDDPDIAGAENLHGAIVTIVTADLVMSLDNVIAVAAAARNSIVLVVLGLAISIPIVMGGATLLLRLIDRFPALVWIGAGLIAYTGAELILADPYVHDSGLRQQYLTSHVLVRGASVLVAAACLGIAWMLRRRSEQPA
jgi:YjbE family integral membrane protein